MELLKLLSANELIAQVINFLILLFLLRIFLWKKVLNLLDARKAKIHAELKGIEDTKLELEGLKSKYETQLDYIEEEAKERIRRAVEEAKSITDGMKKEAQEESQKIVEAARQEVKYEIVKAKEEIKDQIIDLTIKSTQHLIGEKLTAADDKRLVEDFLKDIDALE